jgi:hypothetical protein
MVVRHRLAGQQPGHEPSHGFQVTFFRSRTGLAEGHPEPLCTPSTCCLHMPP